ncbi:MAG: hypothetical protein IIC11_00305 [Proteobacteria bacterium]|nr:hypothetical protein [Pseudomonadota bacterium]
MTRFHLQHDFPHLHPRIPPAHIIDWPMGFLLLAMYSTTIDSGQVVNKPQYHVV